MKKIFTLLVALVSITSVFAQQGYRNDNSSTDRRNTSTVYQNHGNGYNTGNSGYQGNTSNQKGWNDNDRRNDYGNRDDHKQMNVYDQRRNDYDRRDRYDDRGRVVYSNVQTRTNLTTVAGALIIGGILGAILSH